MRPGKKPSFEASPLGGVEGAVEGAVEDEFAKEAAPESSVPPADIEPVDETKFVSASAPEASTDEKYYRVFIHEKSRQEDSNTIYVAVNGESLVLRRGSEVVLPQRFIEDLNHAVVPTYANEADPYNGRAKTGAVRRAGYNILGPSTKEEFRRMKVEGRRALEQAAIALSQSASNQLLR